MVPSVQQRLWDLLMRDELAHSDLAWQEIVLRSGILPLLIKAAAHVAKLAVAKADPSLLLANSTACNVMIDLCHDLWQLLTAYSV